MASPTRNDFVIARENGVTLQYVTGTPGNVPPIAALAAAPVGCPKGTWNFNKTVAEVDDNIDY